MSKDVMSTRLDDGSIGCSQCKLPLTKARSPFYVRKEYVGHFDSLDCPLCHFHVFTEKGYDDAMQMGCRYGLVGPPEEVETCETTQSQDTPVGLVTSRIVWEQFAIMPVQGQISPLQFSEGCNRAIDHDHKDHDAVLRGLLDTTIPPVQSSLKAAEQLVMVDVK